MSSIERLGLPRRISVTIGDMTRWSLRWSCIAIVVAACGGSDDTPASSTSSTGAGGSATNPTGGSGGAAAPTVTPHLFNVFTNEVDPRFPELPASLSTVELMPETTLQVSFDSEVASVRIAIDGDTRIDDAAPFRWTEDDSGEAVPWALSPGSHTITIDGYAEAGAMGEPVAHRELTFEITTAGTDSSPEDGEHEVHRLWLTGNGVYVHRNAQDDFVDASGNVILAAGDVSLIEEAPDQSYFVANGGAADTIAFAFMVLLPDGYDPNVSYPLVTFLHHGWDAYRGTDNDGLPLSAPLFAGTRSLINSETRHAFPAIVLIPQMVRRESIDGVSHEWAAFTDISNETGAMSTAPEPSNNARFVLDVIDALLTQNLVVDGSKPTIDPRRIYLTGHSMGSLGTWDLLPRRPDLWAAGVPMAGYSDHATAAALVDTPIWAFHHEIDCYNPVVGTETMYSLITEAPNNGTRMKFTKLTFDTNGACDQAHFRTPSAAWEDEPGLFAWTFSQVRP